ncbi:MAG: PAS domain-containing protein [Sulfurospirillum sp.]|nr:PAS domain-containing protein [Sulfurospirillum sp.]
MVENNELLLEETSLLVSQTDLKGKIVYANDIFLKFSEYSLDELLGKPHNIIRHKDMPKAAFKDLWTHVQAGKTWQGFVKNRSKTGKFYWVYATVFPFGGTHYLSIRKMASRDEIEKYTAIYKQMIAEERR